MASINIYLHFNGNCREAFEFYKSIFGGKYSFIGTFGDMPPQGDGPTPMPDEIKGRIMHVALPISDETILMGRDTGGEWAPHFKQGNNFSISVNTGSKDEAGQFFNSLVKGGSPTIPMAETFWKEYFGMLTDKFGINWMISYPLPSHKGRPEE